MPAQTKSRAKRASSKKTTVAVAIVLDASTSMSWLAPAVRESFNEYVRKLTEQEGDTVLSLTVFADRPTFVYDGRPIADVDPVTEETYHANGNTALYDSIAETAERLDERLQKQGLEDDVKVVILTVTDGQENRSTRFPRHQPEKLAAFVEEYEKRGNWTFTWIGLGHDNASRQAHAGVGYNADNGYIPEASVAGVNSSFMAMASATGTLRSSGKMSSRDMLRDAGLRIDAQSQPVTGEHSLSDVLRGNQ